MNIETQKKQTGRSADSETVQLESVNFKDTTTPLKLNEVQIELIIETLSPNANQQHRFIEYLGRNPLSRTKACCRAIACVNLSTLRERTLSALADFGLEARCTHPLNPIKNDFGESTDEHLWSIYEKKVES